MLSMQNISMVYRAGLVETHALREFSLEVGEGEFVSVTGPSGSGKTTFLNIAGLLEHFTDGRYELDGRDVSGLSDAESSTVRNEKIGFVFQSASNNVSPLPGPWPESQDSCWQMSLPETSTLKWPWASWN
jgi:putative ABC transport system ATP-binding protein